MRYLTLSYFVLASMIGVSASDAAAQEAEATAEGSEVVTQEPAAATETTEAPEAIPQERPLLSVPAETASVSRVSYDDYRRDELEKKARRSRNVLIGTTAATVVGLPLWIAGSRSHCFKYIDGSGSEQVSCDTAGKAMRGIGIPLLFGGTTGMVISGIMLGVRKGKLRDLGDRVERSKSRALRWDLASSQFVF